MLVGASRSVRLPNLFTFRPVSKPSACLMHTSVRRSSGSSERDFYKDLGLTPEASQDEIKDAFYALSKELHPDRRPDDPQAKQRFQRVLDANQVLGSSRLRKIYDQRRHNRPIDASNSDHVKSYEHTYESEGSELRSRRVQRELRVGDAYKLDFYIRNKTSREFRRQQFRKQVGAAGGASSVFSSQSTSRKSNSEGASKLATVITLLVLFIAISLLRHGGPS